MGYNTHHNVPIHHGERNTSLVGVNMVYDPDKWVMVKFVNNGETIYKIFTSWYGGYLHGDSWQLNSGCTRIEEDGDYYLFHGTSGSIYRCHKDTYGMSGYTSGVFGNFVRKFEGCEDASMELMPEDTNFMELHYE